MLRHRQRIHAVWLAFKRLGADSRGVTALEYGLLAGMMVVAIVTTFSGVANPLKILFVSVSSGL
jgi:Flp pilus assembly pilin Flp